MIDTPVFLLDPDCPRDVVLKNSIAEMYDYFISELGLFQARETGDLSGSILALTKKILAADEAAQLKLELDWLAERGLTMDDGAHSGVKKFLALFNRHANLSRSMKLETIAAPVRLWRAGDSRHASRPTAPEICGRITRGGFAEEILDGRHFELMHPPLVKTLAAKLAAALSENFRVEEAAIH
jgi:thioesterase domain-containing protein